MRLGYEALMQRLPEGVQGVAVAVPKGAVCHVCDDEGEDDDDLVLKVRALLPADVGCMPCSHAKPWPYCWLLSLPGLCLSSGCPTLLPCCFLLSCSPAVLPTRSPAPTCSAASATCLPT